MTTMKKKHIFDLIVIGGGSAGYASARTAYEQNVKVAVVDNAKELGGLCILRGCMPSKTLLYSAEILHLANRGQTFGFDQANLGSDMEKMQQRKKEIIAEFADYRTEQLKDGRFSLFRSKAKFLDSKTLELTLSLIHI